MTLGKSGKQSRSSIPVVSPTNNRLMKHKPISAGLCNLGTKLLTKAKIMAFNAFEHLDTLLTQPVMLIAGSEAGTRWQSEAAFQRVQGEKELVIIDGVNHFDLYDQQPYVDQAVEKLSEFFGKTCKNCPLGLAGQLAAWPSPRQTDRLVTGCSAFPGHHLPPLATDHGPPGLGLYLSTGCLGISTNSDAA